MPLAFLIVGIIFLVAAVRGKHRELFSLLKSDFTGSNNFILWALSLWVIMAIGYFKPLKTVSDAFLALVLLNLLLHNKGFFDKFMQQIRSTETPQFIGNVHNDPVSSALATFKFITHKIGL